MSCCSGCNSSETSIKFITYFECFFVCVCFPGVLHGLYCRCVFCVIACIYINIYCYLVLVILIRSGWTNSHSTSPYNGLVSNTAVPSPLHQAYSVSNPSDHTRGIMFRTDASMNWSPSFAPFSDSNHTFEIISKIVFIHLFIHYRTSHRLLFSLLEWSWCFARRVEVLSEILR